MKYLAGLLIIMMSFTACLEKESTTQSTTEEGKTAQLEAPACPPCAEAAQATTECPDKSEVLAKVNGENITDDEVYQVIKPRLKKIESQIFDIKLGSLKGVIEDKLIDNEAKKQNVSPEELLKTEVLSKVEDPTEAEIETYYNLFKKNLNNQPLEKVRPNLVAQIKATKLQAERDKFVKTLKQDAKIEILMERPRVEVSADDDPSQGDPNAPIQLVEFSEFQCPFCKRSRPTIKRILEEYKGKVHYVFRDFPLSFHKQAPIAAEAANCAGDQGKYWEYNTTIFENQRNIQTSDLQDYAKKLGLDMKKFTQCLDSGKFKDEIQKDIQDGAKAGVSGTPAYFINGIFLSGAQPFENFKEIIDEELDRLKK